MAGIKSIADYPWLCNTTDRLESPISDGNNIVCTNETDTADEVVQDAYEKYGLRCVYYRVTEDLLRDKVFSEDQLRMIQRSWYFNGYIEQLPPNVRSYQLQGIWGEDVVRMYASIGAFNYYSTYGGADKNTPGVYDEQPPSIGDIIYIPQNDTFYRIVDVKYYEQAFGLKPHTYTFTLKVYKDNKWTVSADSPTLSDPEDPIYEVASYPLSADIQVDDPLKVNPVVSEDARFDPDPYNNVNVLYDPNAHARVQTDRLQREIEEESRRLAEEITALSADTGYIKKESEEYIGKVASYVEVNTKRIDDVTGLSDAVRSGTIAVSADGKVLGDLADNKETVYYTGENGRVERPGRVKVGQPPRIQTTPGDTAMARIDNAIENLSDALALADSRLVVEPNPAAGGYNIRVIPNRFAVVGRQSVDPDTDTYAIGDFQKIDGMPVGGFDPVNSVIVRTR